MNSEEIKLLVEQELEYRDHLRGAHGITSENVFDFLVLPYKQQKLRDPADMSPRDHWVIIDEDKDSNRGYLVIFDENSSMFGLATKPTDNEHGTLIGLYGDLINTLNAM